MHFDPQANYVPEASSSDLPGGGHERGSSGLMRIMGRMFALSAVGVVGAAGWWFWSQNTAVGESASDSIFQRAGPQLVAWRTDERVTRAYEAGLSLERSGRYEDAIPYFAEAVVLAPEFAAGRYHLGLSYARSGDDASAQAERKRLEQIDPSLAVQLAAHIP